MTQRGRGDEVPSLEERIDELRRVVDLLVRKMDAEFDVDLDFSPGTVRYMDAIVTEVRTSGRPLQPSLFLTIGGYLGETLTRTIGGRWTEMDGNLAVIVQGEGHSRTLRVFDWVKEAYRAPAEHSLSARVHRLIGDGFDHASGTGEASA